MSDSCIIYCPEKSSQCEKFYKNAVKAVQGDSIETTGKGPSDENFEKGLDKRIEEQKNGLCRPGTDAWKRHNAKMEELKVSLKNNIDDFDNNGCGARLNRDIPPDVRSKLKDPLPGDDTNGPNFDDDECFKKVEKPYLERKKSEENKKSGALELLAAATLIGVGIAVSVFVPLAAPAIAEGESVILPELIGFGFAL